MDSKLNIAVIGTGKTGGEVLRLVDGQRVVGPFDSGNPPTAAALEPADAAVIFVPGGAVDDIFDAVLESAVPAAWGTTGYDWPDDLDRRLRERGVKWLKASNFSLGMNVVRRCLRVLSEGSEVLDRPSFSIHEVHHTDKEDAPSGTALSWREWLGREAEITSERKGDVKGIHRLEIQTKRESIWLKHQARERSVFAEGALWAAGLLASDRTEPGFHDFSELFDRAVSEGGITTNSERHE